MSPDQPPTPGSELGADAASLDRADSSTRILARIRQERSGSARYTVRGEIARGGMGAIYKVWDEELRRTLAMKIVLGKAENESQVDDVKLARFLEEAQITGQLDHPGVVPVHEIGINSEGRVFFTMQLVKGRDLKAIFGLVRAGAEGWNLTRALSVIQRVCEAMAFAHEKQVVHRDLKPANVMVGRFGETYVMDWGLAKVLGREDSRDVRIRPPDQVSLSFVQTDRGDSSGRNQGSPLQTMDGDVIGTPCHMAPEQARGALEDIGPQTDVYAVGTLLYELLTGFAPYLSSGERISPVAVLGMVMHGPPAAIAALDRDVPGELIAICEKAMARAPGERYASMMAMAEDLRAFLEDRVVSAYETGALAEFKKWVGRNRAMAATAAAAVLVALLGLGGVAAVQARANEQLTRTNDELSRTRDQLASSNDELGAANESLLAATARAQEQEREARASGYSANLAAAAASLESGAVREARRRLDLCPADLRGWEWRRLDLATDSSAWSRDLKRELWAPSCFPAAAIDGAGTRAVFATAWGTLLVVDPRSGETLQEFSQTRPSSCVSFTPDGRHLVTAGVDRALHVLSADTGAELRSFDAQRALIQDLDVSPDGTRILSTSLDRYVRIWDFETGAEVLALRLDSAVTAGQWAPDGAHFATGTQNSIVRVHAASTGAVLRELRGHRFSISDLAFGPGGRHLASAEVDAMIDVEKREGSRAGSVWVWDVETGRELSVLRGHSEGITSVNFLSGGALVTTSLDRSLRHFDLTSGHSRAIYGHAAGLMCAVVTPDGTSLVTGANDWTLRGWVPGCSTGVDLTPHPRALVGLRVTSAGEVVSLSRDGILRLQDADTGEIRHDFREHPSVALDLTYAPGNGRLATIGGAFSSSYAIAEFKRLCLWDLGTRTLLLEREFGETLEDVDITPDGSLLAAGTSSGKILLIDGRTGDLRTALEQEGSVEVVALHPDGRRLACSGGPTGSTSVWDLEEGTARPLHEGPSRALRFVAEGELLALCAGNTASLWRADDLTQVVAFQGHSSRVESLVLSPGGARAATASEDGSVRVWNAATGDMLLSLDEPGGKPVVLEFLPDGERLAVGFDSGRAHVYSAARSEQAEQVYIESRRVRSAAHRVLTVLFEELVEPEQVARQLRSDGALDPAVRDAALAVARRIETTPQQLEEECWSVVRTPFAVRPALEQVVWKARLAGARDGEDENALRLLGMALFRLGRYPQALEALERSDILRVRTRRARPDVAAFLAMANQRLGRPEEGAAQMERLRALMSISALQANRDSVALMTEAEELLKVQGR